MAFYKKHIFICTNQKKPGKTCCANTGGEPFFDYLKKQLSKMGLHGKDKIRISKSGCLGRCSLGPCMVVYPEGTWYNYSTFSDIDDIIDNHLLHEKQVNHLLIDKPEFDL